MLSQWGAEFCFNCLCLNQFRLNYAPPFGVMETPVPVWPKPCSRPSAGPPPWSASQWALGQLGGSHNRSFSPLGCGGPVPQQGGPQGGLAAPGVGTFLSTGCCHRVVLACPETCQALEKTKEGSLPLGLKPWALHHAYIVGNWVLSSGYGCCFLREFTFVPEMLLCLGGRPPDIK